LYQLKSFNQSDVLLQLPLAAVSRFVNRYVEEEILSKLSQCLPVPNELKKGKMAFCRLDLLEFRKLISNVFDGTGCQKTGAQLTFEPVEVVLLGGSICLGLPPPLKSIVSKNCGSKGDS